MWKLAPLEEKREFIERARNDKVRYFQEKKHFDDSVTKTDQVGHPGSHGSSDDEGHEPMGNPL